MSRELDIHDIYQITSDKEEGTYFIVTETINGHAAKAMPLSEYILRYYIGSTQEALKMYEAIICEQKTKIGKEWQE